MNRDRAVELLRLSNIAYCNNDLFVFDEGTLSLDSVRSISIEQRGFNENKYYIKMNFSSKGREEISHECATCGVRGVLISLAIDNLEEVWLCNKCLTIFRKLGGEY